MYRYQRRLRPMPLPSKLVSAEEEAARERMASFLTAGARETQRCRRCGVEKPYRDFAFQLRGGRLEICTTCETS